jgi:tRNA-specific 2-thiouridylase
MTKTAVRESARARGLHVAAKPDSHEICFVPDGDYASFVERRAGRVAVQGGVIKDVCGAPLGTHRGVHRFTVGQRKGLGLAAGQPLYVVALDADTQTVVVGPKRALERTEVRVSDVSWIAGAAPTSAVRAAVQIRHKHQAAPATITPDGPARAHVVFETPQTAVSPGQAAVFYDGDVVLGGGWIET